MILRRIADAIREQNWFTVIIEIFIVVIGIFLGLQVSEWNDQRKQDQKTRVVLETLRSDMQHVIQFDRTFAGEIKKGLLAWDQAFQAGERPAPYFYRIGGAEMPPVKSWDALLNMNLGELVHPRLMFELAFYYSEREGVGHRYIRYTTFVEKEIMPLYKLDSAVFYVPDGSRLKPEFENSMDILREWVEFSIVNADWAQCLVDNLELIGSGVETCIPTFNHFNSAEAGLSGAEQ